jgi:hypothetical protein
MNSIFKILLITILFIQNTLGQDFPFSENGKMQSSQIEIEKTIAINTKINGSEIIFYKIDSTFLKDETVNSHIRELVEYYISDSINEYFCLANITTDTILIKRQNKLIASNVIAKNKMGNFFPINYYYYFKCGTGVEYSDIKLLPNEIIILKQKYLKLSGNYLTTAFLKISTSNKGIIISKKYSTKIDYNIFFLNNEFKKYYFLEKIRMIDYK